MIPSRAPPSGSANPKAIARSSIWTQESRLWTFCHRVGLSRVEAAQSRCFSRQRCGHEVCFPDIASLFFGEESTCPASGQSMVKTELLCQVPRRFAHGSRIHGARLGALPYRAVPTGRLLRDVRDAASDCVVVWCRICKRASEYHAPKSPKS